ncbi:hypothetical protein MKK64_17415 [Methylobacterium sp. E-025]|uniref:hypothetical protein n=1 Tax=Methylobacterium sp. E-025 TaxID=2836561 RepID=UPI001FB9D0B6|nr:hypothetical protein [Methylobacterium sp. E-025]MCJ2112962.1 hypothetical protein [Methylobacterium sp. E-025]
MAKAPDKNEKPLCFVVGPIDTAGSEVRKRSDMILHGIIKAVLEEADFSYEVRRADDDARPGMINDRIIHDIINASLVIVDLTGQNPNVFYELGIRHATEKPTIHMAVAGTKLPFDNAGHDTIFVDITDWHSITATRERLSLALREIRKDGYRVSNPITQANASFELRKSTDTKDQIIVELTDRIGRLEKLNSRDSDNTSNRFSTNKLLSLAGGFDNEDMRLINMLRANAALIDDPAHFTNFIATFDTNALANFTLVRVTPETIQFKLKGSPVYISKNGDWGLGYAP